MNMNGTGSELTELELKALVGETAWGQMINEDDSKTPTILVGRDQQHENIFIAFQSRSEVEYLLSQLTSLLVHQQVEDAEYTVSVRGRSMTAGDYYALTPQFSDGYSEQD